MTANKNFKRRVRERASKTGESYTAAMRQIRSAPAAGKSEFKARSIRLGVAQSRVCDDPGNVGELESCAMEIRELIHQAHRQGARIVHFPEGATCSPHKRVMSIDGPDTVSAADWSRARWDLLQRELKSISALAGALGIWVVLGAVHELTQPNRPHNSLYVISDWGELITRYDERMLSNTKLSYMYSPGSSPITFTVDGFVFGCSLGMEVHFPEIFIEYERLDVDCVLFSTTGQPTAQPNEVFVTEARAHAMTNSFWVSYATTAQDATNSPSCVVSPEGQWLARCPKADSAAVTVVELTDDSANIARPWRRKARSGIYEPLVVRDDPRSSNRAKI
jgi:predicted amidohydrolase